MNLITVLGASGFIGSHLVKRLEEKGLRSYAPTRDEDISKKDLGNIIYCIGLTADFRSRPFDTVEAHVCKLLEILKTCTFDDLLYLSSTRVYGSQLPLAGEEDTICTNPLDFNDLYNISKIMGESLVLAHGKNTKIVRISNVYGADFKSYNFISSIVEEAITSKRIISHLSLSSEKDYISIDKVIDILLEICSKGQHRIYNLASGFNVTNNELLRKISELTDCEFKVNPNAETVTYPRIDIRRISAEFNFKPSNILDDLEDLLDIYNNEVSK